MNHQDNQVSVNPKFLVIVIFIIIVLIVGSKSFVIVEPGTACLVKRMGEIVGDPHSEGLLILTPFIDKPVIMDIRTQKLLLRAKAESKDLQSVDCEIVLNYHAMVDEIGIIYQKIGMNYEDKVITPALYEAFKSTTASYNAEELITRRSEVSLGVTETIRKKLLQLGIKLEALSIQDFSFSPKYANAIEMKQVAEQDALRAENELKRVTTQQKQLIEKALAEGKSTEIRARAEAKAITIRAQAEAGALELLAKFAKPDALRARTIEKWNGVLPKVMGGVTPFIDVDQLIK